MRHLMLKRRSRDQTGSSLSEGIVEHRKMFVAEGSNPCMTPGHHKIRNIHRGITKQLAIKILATSILWGISVIEKQRKRAYCPVDLRREGRVVMLSQFSVQHQPLTFDTELGLGAPCRPF